MCRLLEHILCGVRVLRLLRVLVMPRDASRAAQRADGAITYATRAPARRGRGALLLARDRARPQLMISVRHRVSMHHHCDSHCMPALCLPHHHSSLKALAGDMV